VFSGLKALLHSSAMQLYLRFTVSPAKALGKKKAPKRFFPISMLTQFGLPMNL
jgi:hypothetical protein